MLTCQLLLALMGGGDAYELCFTADPADRERVLQAAACAETPVVRVGRVVSGTALVVLDVTGKMMSGLPLGFDHFAR